MKKKQLPSVICYLVALIVFIAGTISTYFVSAEGALQQSVQQLMYIKSVSIALFFLLLAIYHNRRD